MDMPLTLAPEGELWVDLMGVPPEHWFSYGIFLDRIEYSSLEVLQYKLMGEVPAEDIQEEVDDPI